MSKVVLIKNKIKNFKKKSINVDGDKSLSIRFVLLSSLSKGKSIASNLLRSEDVDSAINSIRKLGIKIKIKNDICEVNGKGLFGFNYKKNLVLDLENSGTSARLITSMLSNTNYWIKVTGDKSLKKRDMSRIIKPLKSFGIKFKDNIVLDLFSGSGSFGIECLSRGVKKVYFFENYKPSLKVLEKNIKELEIDKDSVIKEINAYEISKENIDNEKVNLIYLDPPFKDKNINKLLRKILDLKIAHKSTLIVIHRNKKFKENFIEDFKVLREKKYGLSKIIFGKLLF